MKSLAHTAYNKLAHLSLKEKQKGIVTYGTRFVRPVVLL
jgi:hypothetical protein